MENVNIENTDIKEIVRRSMGRRRYGQARAGVRDAAQLRQAELPAPPSLRISMIRRKWINTGAGASGPLRSGAAIQRHWRD